MAYLITCPPLFCIHKFVRFANKCATSLIVTKKAINVVFPTRLIFVTASLRLSFTVIQVNVMK